MSFGKVILYFILTSFDFFGLLYHLVFEVSFRDVGDRDLGMLRSSCFYCVTVNTIPEGVHKVGPYAQTQMPDTLHIIYSSLTTTT